MPDLSRRTLLRASAGVAAIAVPMSALARADRIAGRSLDGAKTKEELEAFGADAVVFHVRDASKGEVSILQGSNEVVVNDKQLVARVMRAANAVQAG